MSLFLVLAACAALAVVLGPLAAQAQVIKPPPVILESRMARVEPAAAGFRPVRTVYRQAEGERFGKPVGVFVERETGEVLVADAANNLVTILSRDGVPLHSFGYNGEVIQPTRAVLDKHGRVLVLAGVPRKLKVFSYRGEGLGDFDFPGFEGAAPPRPTALTVDETGNLYVAEDASGQILVYDPQGRLTMRFGKRGQGPGAFTSITAMAVDSSGTIYVVDARHEPAIQVFDAKGTYLRGWGEHSGGPQNVSLPSGIAVDPSGRVFVADTIRQTVAVFTSEGRYLFRFGGLGPRPGDIAFPSGLDADGSGRLYVTEIGNARLQVFEPADRGAGGRRGVRPPGESRREREAIRRELRDAMKDLRQ